ncbi:Predicted transcriptional regulator, contains HTH domain [Natronoarchaeum philippinense]|uniref:Predicted transcriptional regulator, contains HTH domain n=1 Tax=Natronoarchaeum philippinense TaxID=558529 RepID=A0A285NQP9_NATPI|nr:MarR family transcriptional regulator [Natronoarchaeum philippinense]SNZ11769.1 Predicted transcriptional regulator, contains HTH domain [Natronoarchaeum philippinense]
MADDADPVEQIAFLARSNARVRVLEQLLDSGSADQRTLRTRLDASRSTIARTLTALEQRGWIETDGSVYRLTTVGTIVAEEFEELADALRVTDEFSTFLEWFPYSEFDLDLAELQDSTITTATSSDPYAAGRTQTEFLYATDRFLGFLPAIDIEGTRVVHEQITEHGFEAEIVVSAEVSETITQGEYADLFRAQLETGQLTVLVHDGALPFYLGLGDEERVQIGVEDDEGFPRALLESSAQTVRRWAEDVYEEYRATAQPMSFEEF